VPRLSFVDATVFAVLAFAATPLPQSLPPPLLHFFPYCRFKKGLFLFSKT
jgi:hypothetical protein